MRREDQAVLSTMMGLFQSFGAEIAQGLKEDSEARVIVTGWNDYFFNNIYLKKPRHPERLVDEIKGFHQQLKKPLIVWVTSETEADADVLDALKQNFVTHGNFYGMWLNLDEAQLVACPAHIQIESVQTEQDAEDFSKLLCDVFQLNNVRDELKKWAIKQSRMDQPDALNYLARLNGKLAGACSLSIDRQFKEGQTGGFYNAAVLPEFRRAGVGSAMASHRARVARSMGLDSLSIVLMSDAMARGYCEKLGFKDYQPLTPFFL